jgi:hypothetical protein
MLAVAAGLAPADVAPTIDLVVEGASSIESIVDTVRLQARAPICFERDTAPSLGGPLSISLHRASLPEALSKVVALDERYTWQQDETGVISVFPVLRGNDPGYFMNKQVTEYVVTDKTLLDVLTDLTRAQYLPGMVPRVPAGGAKLAFSVRDVTVRVLLNRLVAEAGGACYYRVIAGRITVFYSLAPRVAVNK